MAWDYEGHRVVNLRHWPRYQRFSGVCLHTHGTGTRSLSEGEVGHESELFLKGQLLKAGQLLGDIGLTAWKTAPEDGYF